MRTLLLFVAAALLLATPAIELAYPDLVPAALRGSEPGLHPSYGELYERWEVARKQQRWTEALAWADEYLMSVGGRGTYARDALAMRRVARARGGEGPPTWLERAPSWRLKRVVLRRPTSSWLAGGLGLLTGLVALYSLVVRLRPRPYVPVGYDGPIGPRPWAVRPDPDQEPPA